MQHIYKKKALSSTLRYVLEGLIPYTDANLKLSFKPGLFFRDLETISRMKQGTLRNAYYSSAKRGLVSFDKQGLPSLTQAGRELLEPYIPTQLENAKLLVIFDIPEVDRWKRQHLRLLLRELSFVQVQKSVWETIYDHRDYLRAEIKQLKLETHVHIYEAIKL